MRWLDFAACIGHDPDIFFPRRGQGPYEAKRICSTCPVMKACRSYAMTNQERLGVWGGLTWNERHRLQHGKPEQVCDKCGTRYVPHNQNWTTCSWCQRWRNLRPRRKAAETL